MEPAQSHIVYTNVKQNIFVMTSLIAADVVGCKDVKMVHLDDDMRKAPEHAKKFYASSCPQLETPEGTI